MEKSLQSLQDEIQIHERIELNHRLIKAEFDNCRNYIKNFGHEVQDDDAVLGEYRGMDGVDASGGDLLSLYRSALQSRVCAYEDQSSNARLERLEQEYYQIEKAAQHYLEHARGRRVLRGSIADLEKRMAEKKDEKEKILGFLRDEFGCGDIGERMFAELFGRGEGDF